VRQRENCLARSIQQEKHADPTQKKNRKVSKVDMGMNGAGGPIPRTKRQAISNVTKHPDPRRKKKNNKAREENKPGMVHRRKEGAS